MKHILLVEDHRELATITAASLREAGYAVTWAEEGRAALDVMARESIDLVVLDWMLPGMDGTAVLTELRRGAYLPVLMLTARHETADRIIGLELGADDYMTKPFSQRELQVRVKALFRTVSMVRATLEQDRSLPREAPLTYGSLQLDPSRFAVNAPSGAVSLTRTELALLRLLFRYPGRVFSRDYLLETAWEADALGGDRAVDNVVLRLRRKLPSLAIEAVYGIGYRLVPPSKVAS